MSATTSASLAIRGGPRAVRSDPGDMFKWPIVTREDEEAVLEVLRRGAMSGTEITKLFEREFADWLGAKYALACCNGTASLQAAMWACGVGAGDEVIAPTMTYWASCTSALALGAAVNFADIDPETLCIAPSDIEARIGPRTRVIVVVHYAGHPCDMDPIMEIARRRGVKVVEDVSHAHGGLYKGRRLGTIGDAAGMSLMSGKSFPAGEGGMLVTNDRLIYERAVAYGHYERTGVASNFNVADAQVTEPELLRYAGITLSGAKHRINQLASAMGRVQLRHYPARMAEIQKAMNRFWDLLEGVPGIRPHRPAAGSGSTMAGWYFARGIYHGEELGGISCAKFCEAVRAEGVPMCFPGANKPLHVHPVFHTADLFRMGRPTVLSFGQRDVRQGPGTLSAAERIDEIAFGVPWFKHDRPDIIAEYAAAYRKVAEGAGELR
ncbi:MAG TPA: DegT/DnrJ/EryC1/StrS family aminotransferase [Planctomycetota bacterium]|nr:DegT/DnrJ/EryC1/StrS family aminotransferase [Planctomycetota bacterium]